MKMIRIENNGKFYYANLVVTRTLNAPINSLELSFFSDPMPSDGLLASCDGHLFFDLNGSCYNKNGSQNKNIGISYYDSWWLGKYD